MKRVLVVDNHPVILRYLESILEKNGHLVQTASDGISALSILDHFSPDICFVDLIMENISGDKLIKIIRSLPEHQHVFMVIISAVAIEDSTSCADYQADAFIAKGPFDQMSKHVLQIVDVLGTAEIDRIRGRVLGREGLHAREITRELLLSRAHFQTALNNISEGYLELLGGKVIFANPAALMILGYSEERMLNRNFLSLLEADIVERISYLLTHSEYSGQRVEIEEPLLINDKSVLIKIIPVHEDQFQSLLIILSDISRQQYLESQIRNTQKMEAISTLAGGIAHDLNNILSGLVSYPDSIITQLSQDSELIEPLQTIKASGEKAAVIVQDLLTLSQKNRVHKEVVELNQIIAEYVKSVEYRQLVAAYPEVEITVELSEAPDSILGVSIHLYKLVMNLVSNACEAIPGRGTVVIRTLSGCPEGFPKPSNRAGQSYVALQVSDEGVGLSEEEKDRIFEPFYTTKKMGRSGTGLGMAVVWGVVTSHDGVIDVNSSVGEGTRITICFPVLQEQKAIAAPSTEAADEHRDLAGTSILVVDDVEEQLQIASHILKYLGVAVQTASSVEAALQVVLEKEIDLVLLDLNLGPGPDGLEVYQRIVSCKPEQKVVMVSGYAEKQRIQTALELGIQGFLQKPYTVLCLREKLRHVLKDL